MLERLDAVRVQSQRLTRECHASCDIASRVALLRAEEQRVRLFAGRRQLSPSTNRNASGSVNTRNEFVRTLPWPLTASDTRVIVSSSGASATTT